MQNKRARLKSEKKEEKAKGRKKCKDFYTF